MKALRTEVLGILLLTIVVTTTTGQVTSFCKDLNTPHLPPVGVISQAGYGAPCKNRPCENGMDCCLNSRRKPVCEDVDECTSNLLNNCEQNCQNENGTYSCSCDNNSRLLSDRETCEPIVNPIASDCDEAVICSGHGTCLEEISGDVICICDNGWSSSNCSQNIEDCTEGRCSNGGTCTDQVDGFTCSCHPAWTGSTCGEDVTECNDTVCGDNGRCIERVGGGFVCRCDPGIGGDNCDQDIIDECFSEPCKNNGVCTDGLNNFTCICRAAWTGDTCESYQDCGGEYYANPLSGTCLRFIPPVFAKLANWTAAADLCAAKSEYLAVFPTREEVDWLYEFTSNTSYDEAWRNGEDDFWIGITEDNGLWSWTGRVEDEVESSLFAFGLPGFSDNWCGEIKADSLSLFYDSCSYSSGYICEKTYN